MPSATADDEVSSTGHEDFDWPVQGNTINLNQGNQKAFQSSRGLSACRLHCLFNLSVRLSINKWSSQVHGAIAMGSYALQLVTYNTENVDVLAVTIQKLRKPNARQRSVKQLWNNSLKWVADWSIWRSYRFSLRRTVALWGTLAKLCKHWLTVCLGTFLE